jgi:large subunit ribosomal protein L1
MAILSKKKQAIRKSIDRMRVHTVEEAVTQLKQFASKKFNEGVDIAVNLGVDPRKSDQLVRSSTKLPKGTGKTVRVAVFAQGDNAKKAKDAGADIVGFEDLAESIKAGNLDFDVVIATPDAMRLVGQLGTILGPRGLMPNPKVGTVTPNVEAAVQDSKSGQVRYKTDKNGIIHTSIGKVSFSWEDIAANIGALISDLRKAKPASSKGQYIKRVYISTTMGPGIAIDISSIDV